MRRIKTYVMIVGVALSATPFFNFAFAQQSNSSTELLLQVQTMRQEIAELRDMIERQQFQLKRLQQQTDAQAQQQVQQFEAARGYANTIPGTEYSNNNGAAATAPATVAITAPAPTTGSSIATTNSYPTTGSAPAVDINAGSVVAQPATSSTTLTAGATVPSPGLQASQVQVSQSQPTQLATQGQISRQAAPVGTVETFPPVVDRSFSTSIPVVPVTGAGTQASVNASAQNVFTNQVPVNNQTPVISNGADSSRVYSAAELANTAAQNAAAQVNQTSGVSVISVPTQAQRASQTTQLAVQQSPQNLVNQGLIANQGTQSQFAVNQVAQTQVVPVPSQGGSVPISAGQQAASGQLTQSPNGLPLNGVPVQNQSVAGQVPTAGSVAIAPAVQAAPVLSENDYYSQGFELLKQSKYEDASSIFEQQLAAYPQGELADDAHYWIAEAMHVSRKLDVAKVHLKAIINDYPQSRRLPDAMLKTAYIEQSQGNQIEARILFQEIVNLHPQSDAAIAAKNQLAAVN